MQSSLRQKGRSVCTSIAVTEPLSLHTNKVSLAVIRGLRPSNGRPQSQRDGEELLIMKEGGVRGVPAEHSPITLVTRSEMQMLSPIYWEENKP